MPRPTSLVPALAAFALAFWTASGAEAQVVSSLTSTQVDNQWTTGNGTPTWGRFTLTSTASIVSATLNLTGSAGAASNFTVSLMTESSGFPGSTIATSQSGTGTLSFLSSPINFAFSTPSSLSAGSYWLKLDGTGTTTVNWLSSTTAHLVNTGTGGTVDSHVLSGPANITSQGLQFSLTSTSAVPEPSPLLLSAVVACTGLGLHAWRRRKPRPAVA